MPVVLQCSTCNSAQYNGQPLSQAKRRGKSTLPCSLAWVYMAPWVGGVWVGAFGLAACPTAPMHGFDAAVRGLVDSQGIS